MEARTFIIDDSAGKKQRCAGLILKLPTKDGQIWDVVVKPYEKRRSNDANRRLWALHKLASEATGHSTDELHEMMKHKFLPRSVIKIGKDEVEVSGSSAKLSKKAFGEFMEAVEAFYISELGIFLGDE